MKILTTAKLNWFNDGCCDVLYLDLWDKEPLNFNPQESVDESWHRDHYERIIGQDSSGQLFQIASNLLLNYQFYPTDIISPTSDFSLNDRQAKMGDRIIQRIHLFKLFGFPILDAITMTEITKIVDSPRQATLTYTTVATHVEQGEWSASIEWLNDDQVMLSTSAVSRPVRTEPKRNYGYMRAFQQNAHRHGIEHFVNQVRTAVALPER